MADGTKIEWTDATWQIVTGCSVVSPGCTNCYAMRLAGTRLAHHESRIGLTRETKAGPVWTGEVRFNKQWIDQPLRWKKPRMIFVAAHGDLFHESIPDEWLDQIFAVMALCPQHTFQVLTKRPERAAAYLGHVAMRRIYEIACDMALEMDLPVVLIAPSIDPQFAPPGRRVHLGIWPLPNVWLGTSVEDQRRADERRYPMRWAASGGWLTWVSYEPALGPVDWSGWEFLRWVVSGGESGPGARTHHPDWHRDTRDFCAAQDIAYLFKQQGSWREPLPGEEYDTALGRAGKPPAFIVSRDGTVHCFENDSIVDGRVMIDVGKKRAGRLLDGIEHNGFPVPRAA